MNITNEVVTRYLDGLYRPLTPGLADLRRQAEEEHVPVILRDTERFLASILALVRPERILEVGAAVGYSSSCFAQICGKEYENHDAGSRSCHVPGCIRKYQKSGLRRPDQNHFRRCKGDDPGTEPVL